MSGRLRVLVCGGRDFRDAEQLNALLDTLHAGRNIAYVAHGGARGADHLAGLWAVGRNVTAVAFPAEWEKHGKAAGPIRNRTMLEAAKPDMVIAFPGGRGTANMVKQARAAGVEVVKSVERVEDE